MNRALCMCRIWTESRRLLRSCVLTAVAVGGGSRRGSDAAYDASVGANHPATLHSSAFRSNPIVHAS